MVNLNASLRRLLQTTIGDGVANVEKHRVQNYVFRVMAAFEINAYIWCVLPIAL